MSYPGDRGLDAKIQQRILSAFAEAVRLYQEGNPEECRTVLRSILEVDPSFAPATRLMSAVDAGAPVDLGKLLGEVGAAGGVDLDGALVAARQAFAERDFAHAAESARQVLRELPGHEEARRLVQAAEGRIKAAGEVATRLRQAREAVRRGATDEAADLLERARSLDPSHPELAEIEEVVGSTATRPAREEPVEFEFIPSPAASVGLDSSTVSVAPPRADGFPPPPPVAPPPAARPPAAAPPERAAPGASAPAAAPTAGFVPPSFAPPSTPAQATTPPGEGEFFFGGAPSAPADVDLFSIEDAGSAPAPAVPAPPAEAPAPPAPAMPAPAEAEAAVQVAEATEDAVGALLAQGQAEFDRGDFQGAIETWSRIYLVRSDCPDADKRIEEARRRREELERQADHRFYEARDAFDHGRIDEARALCQEVLRLQPQHIEAHDLLARVETPAAPPPPLAPAAGEEDLFRDDFVPAPAGPTAGVVPGAPAAVSAATTAARAAAPAAARRRLPVPTPLVVILGGLVAILAVVGLLLRSTLFGGKGDVVTTTIAQAEDAARQGRVQEAINLLKSLQATEQLDGSVANQVNQLIVNYQRTMRSQAARTPQVSREPIRAALAAGARVKALRMVRDALAKVPGDTALLALQSEILAYSSGLGPLADAVEARDMDKVRRGAQAVLDAHPDDAEVSGLHDAATFNLALVMLRKYQVGAAKALLDELARRGTDAEVERVREFATRYTSRPVDPRYQIFVTNVELRPLE